MLDSLPIEILTEIFSYIKFDIIKIPHLSKKCNEIFQTNKNIFALNILKNMQFNTKSHNAYNILLQLKSYEYFDLNDLTECFIQASENGHIEIVKLLLDNERVDPTAYDNAAIRCASRYGYTETVKLLLDDERVDPTAYDNFAISCASENGHLEIIKLLLTDERVDPAADDNYAIRYASENGHTEIVDLLLNDPRVDPTAYNNYAIRYASQNGHLEVVKLLADRRVDPSAIYD